MGGLTILAVVVVAYTLVASRLDGGGSPGPWCSSPPGWSLVPGGWMSCPCRWTTRRSWPSPSWPWPCCVRRRLDGPAAGRRGWYRAAPAAVSPYTRRHSRRRALDAPGHRV